MAEKATVPEILHPTVSYRLWSVISRSSELVEHSLSEISELEDQDLQDALWTQHNTAAYGDGSHGVAVWTSPEYGTHSYLVPTTPLNL